MPSQPFFIIVHVIEGKHFPSKKGGVFAECIFNGVSQCSDILPEITNPVWHHEFKWELSQKRLTQFRTEKIPVKLLFYFCEDVNTPKQLLGQLVFSLRSGNDNLGAQWHQLLHSRSKLNPSAKVFFRICEKHIYEEEEAERRKRNIHAEKYRKELFHQSKPKPFFSTKIHSSEIAQEGGEYNNIAFDRVQQQNNYFKNKQTIPGIDKENTKSRLFLTTTRQQPQNEEKEEEEEEFYEEDFETESLQVARDEDEEKKEEDQELEGEVVADHLPESEPSVNVRHISDDAVLNEPPVIITSTTPIIPDVTTTTTTTTSSKVEMPFAEGGMNEFKGKALPEVPGSLIESVNSLESSVANLTEKTMKDLESLKKKKVEKWKKSWKEREEQYFKSLEIEWKQRFEQREDLINQKYIQVVRLEQKLQEMVSELEQRESQLVFAEQDLQTKTQQLKIEYQGKVVFLEDISNKAKTELTHFKALEQLKIQEFERQKKDLNEKLSLSEKKNRDLELEFQSFKLRQNSGQEQKLQADLLSLNSQFSALEKKYEACKKKKKLFKQNSIKFKSDFEKLQQQISQDQELRFQKEQKELEQLKAKFLLSKQPPTSISTLPTSSSSHHHHHDDPFHHHHQQRQELDQLKAELQTLKLREELHHLNSVHQQQQQYSYPSTYSPPLPLPQHPPSSTTQQQPTHHHHHRHQHQSQKVEDEERLEWLLKSKQSLMKTGLYRETDPIISEFNQEIESVKNPSKLRT